MKKRLILPAITAMLTLSILFAPGSVVAGSLTLATMNWEPFYGENLPENGFFAALSREVFKRAGYDVRFEFLPWKRALELSKKGKRDGILGAYYSEERAAHFLYTDPVSQNDEAFFRKKRKAITYTALEDLKPYKIGGIKGGAQVEELIKKGFTLETTMDTLKSAKKLAAGRIDLMIVAKQNFLYDLQNKPEFKPFRDAFEALDPPFKSYELFCPITKKRPDAREIVSKFNAALKEMKADGTYETILTRFGQK